MGYSEWLYEGKIDHWFDSFENFHQKYIILRTEYSNYSVPEVGRYISVMTHPCFINKRTKQDVVSKQPYKCYTEIFFLENWYWELIAIIWWIVLIEVTSNLPLTNKIS